jgi:putative transposase
MQVNRAGYYAWRRGDKSVRTLQNEELTEQIRFAHQKSKSTYGSPRIFADLKEAGVACSQKRIARLMRLAGISASRPKRFTVTTDSNHALPVASNLLDRQFDPESSDTRWSADITYIWTSQGWLYLAVILDLFSRRVVGWAMEQGIERTLVISALEMAITARRPSHGLICHSDRGSQYASGDYRARLKEAGIQCSMSRRANCWDNAPTESFFASLKKELIHRTHFDDRQQARSAIFEWIEVWYNRTRRHSALGYLSPEAFERRHHAHTAAAIAA